MHEIFVSAGDGISLKGVIGKSNIKLWTWPLSALFLVTKDNFQTLNVDWTDKGVNIAIWNWRMTPVSLLKLVKYIYLHKILVVRCIYTKRTSDFGQSTHWTKSLWLQTSRPRVRYIKWWVVGIGRKRTETEFRTIRHCHLLRNWNR